MKVGLYIKDMKMPKAGQVIEISEGITGTVYARISPGFDKWHPVIPVPPHGRLIDADKLCLSSGFSTATEYGRGRSDQIEAIKSNAPTIIPKEKEA